MKDRDNLNTKVCAKCGENLPIELFCKDSNRPDGRDSVCRIDRVKYNRLRRKKIAKGIWQFKTPKPVQIIAGPTVKNYMIPRNEKELSNV